MLTNEPSVCVCVPTYQSAKTIRETIQSLLDQSYRNITIHVVDNASTDDTLTLVQQFEDARIILHTNQEHVSGEQNFNRCINLAHGDYSAIYHADDVYLPDMIMQACFFLQNHDVGVVLTEAYLIDSFSKVTGVLKTPIDVVSSDSTYDFKTLFQAVMKHYNFMICPSAMFKTEVLKHTVTNWSQPKFGNSADLDVWFRVAKAHGVGILPLPLMRYRLSQQQASHLVRRGVERPDFFHVMDHYLSQPEVQAMVNQEDLLHYADLERRNKVMRATSHFMEGHLVKAKALSESWRSTQLWRAAIKNKRGKLTLCLNSLLRIFILFRLHKTGKIVFSRLLNWVAR